ncbi:MAG: xanthine dehydrogenase family protein subunit M [Spirochaetales bacterium]|nr:xanthine dehydrogenase family protein subunit M [Spirochaetales bacterium]
MVGNRRTYPARGDRRVHITYRPETLREALSLMKESGKEKRVKPFAGGTDLMVRHRGWHGTTSGFPSDILFLDRIDELKCCGFYDKEYHIGAACTLAEVEQDDRAPSILKEAITLMAAPALRNRGTLAGNICNASPAGDTLPPLFILDARITLIRQGGSRTIPIEDFITGPGETVLGDDELLAEIRIPITEYTHLCYRKVGTRKANALSKLSFAALAGIEGGEIRDIRIALGAVAPRIVRDREIEASLQGKAFDEIDLRGTLEAYGKLICPIDDQRSTAAYRKQVALNLIENFITRDIREDIQSKE